MRLLPLLLLLLLVACQSDPDPTEYLEEEWSAVLFEPLTYADSVSLRSGPPYSTLKVNTIVATGGDPTLRDTINNALALGLLGYIPTGKDSTLNAALPQFANRMFTEYKAVEINEQLLAEAPRTYSRETIYNTEIVYQSDSLYVLANTRYGYQGGAHGISYTDLLTFTIDPVRHLQFGDVFAAGNEETLSRLLTARAKQADMAASISADTVPVTENIAPLPDGVRFLYGPYEIGPYSSGNIAIDLPYDQMRPLLRKEILPLIAGF